MNPIDVIYIEDDDQEAFVLTLGMRVQQVKIHHINRLDSRDIRLLLDAPYKAMHAILFDAMLAGESGVVLAAALRDAGDTRPIFIITAGENPDTEHLRALNIGYIRKPVDFSDLARTIRASLT